MTNVSYPSCTEKAFWGFAEHFRFWLIFDGVELKRLKRSNTGKLDADSVKRIARNYSVMRGIRSAGKNKFNSSKPIDRLVQIINEFDVAKHTSLEEKAKWCKEKIYVAENNCITHGKQASGITKLLWFRCQEEWTVFDRHASSAVGAKGKNSVERMENYYDKLSDRNFLERAREVDCVLENEGFGFLYGGRVIDAFLMLNSTDPKWPKEAIQNCYWFLENIPKKIRDNVIRVGKKIPQEIKYLVEKK